MHHNRWPGAYEQPAALPEHMAVHCRCSDGAAGMQPLLEPPTTACTVQAQQVVAAGTGAHSSAPCSRCWSTPPAAGPPLCGRSLSHL